MQNNTIMIKKYIMIAVIGFVVFISMVGLYLYQKSFHTLSLTISDGVTAQIYPRYSGDGANNTSYKEDTLIETVEKSGNIRLKEGIYVVHTEAKGDYRETNTVVELNNKDEVTINPPYTEKKLASLLTNEQGDIKKTLLEKYPNIEDLYIINTGKLLDKGKWYGTYLTYKNSGDLYQSDTLRLILKKDHNKWSVTTDPEIVISKVVYPDIPREVIKTVNDL